MALSSRELSDVLGAIYDCALEPQRWPATLERIGDRLRACNGQVMSRGERGLDFAAAWGTSDEERQLYMAQYERINPFTTMDWHFDIDEVVTFESFMPRQELQATRMFREYLAPRGWHDFVLTILEKSSSRVTSFGFTRHAREGAFGEAELELMRLIAPHVRRAVALGGIIVRETARAEDLAAVFARLAMPAFLLDAEGRCLEPNGAALQLLGRALHPAGRLASGGRVARGGAWGGVLMGLGSVAAPASVPLIDDEGHAFVAHVVPLSGADRVVIAGGGRAEAAVFVQQVGGLAPLPGEVLVKLYGLTPAETRLLALLGRGLSVEEAADALGVTMATARTHLARVFDKTGTRRQAELVRLVMSAFPAPLG